MVRKCGGKKTAKGRKKKTERERNKVRGLFIGANIKKRKKKLSFHFQVVKPSFPAKSSLRRDRREREREEEERLCETEPDFEKIREADPINEHWMMVLKLRFQRR